MNIQKLEYYPNIYESVNHVIFVSKNKETEMTEIKIHKKSEFDEVARYNIEGIKNRVHVQNHMIFLNNLESMCNTFIDISTMNISNDNQEYNIIYQWDNNLALAINKSTYQSNIVELLENKVTPIEADIELEIIPTGGGLLIPNLKEKLIQYLLLDGKSEQWRLTLDLTYNKWLHVRNHLILWRSKGHAIHNDEEDSTLIIDLKSGNIKYDLNIHANQVVAHESKDRIIVKQGSKFLEIDLNSGQVIKEKVVDIDSTRSDYKVVKRFADNGIFYSYIDPTSTRIGKINSESLDVEWEYDMEQYLGKGLKIHTWIILPNGKHLINNKRSKDPVTFLLDPRK